ncbi:thioredoxin [Nocardioides mangrovicus]|uniref:Thioredoxin n=1 Tax=Nocardioides mangrovicus TaxID=2478913 RepID=A0A3L8NYF4_9ACTN|nr:thioredoxin family protein [Nocardioides mangrovicus]RLV47677.1 thioredoxin [Nocardioides mangrovicus]
MTGVVVLVVAVVAALAFGVWRRLTDGRFAASAPGAPSDAPGLPAPAPAGLLAGTEFADRLGERATLLQFSSAFCAPCRATRQVLAGVAETVPGVAHVEVDAEQHLALVRRLEVMRTPTTIVLDARGDEITRASGAPSKQQVLAALDSAL